MSLTLCELMVWLDAVYRAYGDMALAVEYVVGETLMCVSLEDGRLQAHLGVRRVVLSVLPPRRASLALPHQEVP